MKTLSALALILAMTFAAAAQRAKNNTDEELKARNAPDLFVFSASAFGPDKRGDSNFTIEVGNMGQKTITAIEWEYYTRREAAASNGRSNLTFRDGELKLRPTERKKLTEKVHYYTDQFVTSFGLSTIRITRVEYEDGSVWKRPADEK